MLGYNTYSHFANQLKDWFIEDRVIVSGFRWMMPEWYSELGQDGPLLEEVNNGLNKLSEKGFEANPDNYKDSLLDMILDVLLEVKGEGHFGAMNEDFFLFLQQADSHIDERMKERVRSLVGKDYFEEFLNDLRSEMLQAQSYRH